MKTAMASVSVRVTNEDRAVVIDVAGGVVIAVADGAGGLGQGSRAAQAWIDAVTAHPRSTSWVSALEELDANPARRGPGQTTAIALAIGDSISGVCVGDSAIWLVTDNDVIDLAEHVPPKPLVGDGCMVYEVAARFDRGTLLVATDGLVKYASRENLARLARLEDLEEAVTSLVELVRLPSGGLQDDTTVVLVRL